MKRNNSNRYLKRALLNLINNHINSCDDAIIVAEQVKFSQERFISLFKKADQETSAYGILVDELCKKISEEKLRKDILTNKDIFIECMERSMGYVMQTRYKLMPLSANADIFSKQQYISRIKELNSKLTVIIDTIMKDRKDLLKKFFYLIRPTRKHSLLFIAHSVNDETEVKSNIKECLHIRK